jgi:glutamate dehydrogenase (NAD(P)+)
MSGASRKHFSPFEIAMHNVDIAARTIKLNGDIVTLIKNPDRELKVELPLMREDGTLQVFTGYRVQHNNARGPFKGGIRYHHEVDLSQMGAKIVAVSDVEGGIYNKKGLGVAELLNYVKKTKGVKDFPGSEPLTNEELLECSCDVLIPAALGGQVTKSNAPRIRAKLIVEGANEPLTYEADEILEAKGIHVVPDILANAGGVTVSYFEWAQNLQQFRWQEDRVNAELETIMVRAFDQVWKKTQEYKVPMRIGAYIVAVERVSKATALRGHH